ncbi:MAG: 3-hydroxyacyl-[acyl-carrier-protein] dehydratase FabZ [Desulfobacterales bacterium CG23_combo_of_CG06-09_8_20_14_all_51_8]|nr:MAG: 3-hydroxyacyl-[acyl-carrier-protein] dehydratase FabZ [Desulfobacterales bacterium CG23_combo_of_CG06-09_8_20_14_all_51_8]
MKQRYDIEKILNRMPHRYPFLLVDRILDLTPGEKIRALKNVTVNEPFFQGHFPGRPVMPGVLIIEGMVQAGGLLLMESVSPEIASRVCFSGVDQARFRAPVTPGDQLIFDVEIVRQRSRMVIMSASAFVDKRRVAEAKLMALIGGKP